MPKSSIKAVLTLVFVAFFSFGFAANEKPAEEGKEFDTSELIFHHIKDSYGFHVAGDLTVPLPVILWTDNGLVTFMSGEFHHDVDGKVIVEKKGLNFVNVHEKIYQLDEGATTVAYDAEHHPTNAKRPLDFSITKNVFSMFLSVLLLMQ